MKCEKVRDMLLTDYLDGETAPDMSEKIREHLGGCPSCRDFERVLKERIAGPLRTAEVENPPERVWSEVKRAIGGRRSGNPVADSLERLRGVLIPRKPVVIVALAAALVMIIAFPAGKNVYERNVTEAYLEEQISFLDSLANGGEWFYEDIGIPDEDIVF